MGNNVEYLVAGRDHERLAEVFEAKTAARITNLYERAQTEDFLTKFYISAVRHDEIRLPSLISDGDVLCNKSLYFEEGAFLYFDDQVLPFFVVQVRRFFDGMYFPSANLYYGRGLASIEGKLKGFVTALLRDNGSVRKYLHGERLRFAGGLVCQRLPYHYFYDVMPGAHQVLSVDVGVVHGVVTVAGANYLSIEEFYNAKVNFLSVKKKDISFLPGLFFVSLLRNDRYNRKILHRDLDGHLVKIIFREARRYSRGITFSSRSPVIWIGVMAGKRTWIEQVQAIVEIIRATEVMYEQPFFIFDGLTSSSDECHLSNDHEGIIKEISKTLNGSASFLNLNGALAAEKIYFANMANYFICDAATSSMYVARFCGIPGVAYSAPGARLTGHIHQNTVFFPAQNVSVASVGRSWDYTDFSISPVAFVDFVVSDIKKRLQVYG